MVLKCLAIAICVILVIAIYFPARHARHYHFIEDENILEELVQSETTKYNLKKCTYENIVLNALEIDENEIYSPRSFNRLLRGGEYSPKDCNPLFKTAILVPYRNRKRQLETFLNYMHDFLQKQKIHYRIFVIEQNNSLPFNRALMFNIGAKVAIDLSYSCLILHDVDLIPLNLANIYACSKKPRHMSCSIDTFRYNLPYLTLFGGAISIQSEHFERINGMSNLFYGWGGEDDDFYLRLEAHDLLPYRFSPKVSTYTMLKHEKQQPSDERFNKLKYTLERHRIDGLSTLSDNYKIKLEPLYTHVSVTSL